MPPPSAFWLPPAILPLFSTYGLFLTRILLLAIVIGCHLAVLFVEYYFIYPQTLIFRYSLPADHRMHPRYWPFGHFFPPFATLNAILRPACRTLPRPDGAVSGSSIRRTTAWHDHVRVNDACNESQWIHIGRGACCRYCRVGIVASLFLNRGCRVSLAAS